jgi:hypothetical protein
MELAGTIAENLNAAIVSARRLRGQSVHADTLRFWQDLLDCALVKASRSALAQSDEMHRLIADLQNELAARGQADAAEATSR